MPVIWVEVLDLVERRVQRLYRDRRQRVRQKRLARLRVDDEDAAIRNDVPWQRSPLLIEEEIASRVHECRVLSPERHESAGRTNRELIRGMERGVPPCRIDIRKRICAREHPREASAEAERDAVLRLNRSHAGEHERL